MPPAVQRLKSGWRVEVSAAAFGTVAECLAAESSRTAAGLDWPLALKRRPHSEVLGLGEEALQNKPCKRDAETLPSGEAPERFLGLLAPAPLSSARAPSLRVPTLPRLRGAATARAARGRWTQRG